MVIDTAVVLLLEEGGLPTGGDEVARALAFLGLELLGLWREAAWDTFSWPVSAG